MHVRIPITIKLVCQIASFIINLTKSWEPIYSYIAMKSPWLFNVYMDRVVQELNVRMLGKGLKLLRANGGRFEINQLLFADDTALVAESEAKFCRLVSEFGTVCERRTLRVNVGKSKVIRCSRYGNGGRMHGILNGESLEEVDCFKYLGSQVAADGGCERDVAHRLNAGIKQGEH